MQDRDDLLRIMKSKTGTLADLAKEPMQEGTTSRTIGVLPKKGEVVKLRGLDFQVRFINYRTGEMRLALCRATEQADGADTQDGD